MMVWPCSFCKDSFIFSAVCVTAFMGSKCTWKLFKMTQHHLHCASLAGSDSAQHVLCAEYRLGIFTCQLTQAKGSFLKARCFVLLQICCTEIVIPLHVLLNIMIIPTRAEEQCSSQNCCLSSHKCCFFSCAGSVVLRAVSLQNASRWNESAPSSSNKLHRLPSETAWNNCDLFPYCDSC